MLSLKVQSVLALSLLGQKKIKVDLDIFQHIWIFSAESFPPFKVEDQRQNKTVLVTTAQRADTAIGCLFYFGR